MQALFWKFFSAFMAFVFSVSGSLPGFIGEIFENPPVESVEVKDIGLNGAFGSESDRVFFSYREWSAFAKNFETEESKDYAAKFDKDFFKEHNLAVADISKPDTAHSVYIESAEEKSNVLKIEYRLTSTEGVVGLDVICYETVFAATSKLVSEVELIEGEKELIISSPVKNVQIFENGDEDGFLSDKDYKIFSDCSEWETFCNTLDEREKNACNEYVSKELFNENNLAIIDITMPGSEPVLYIKEAKEIGNSLVINYLLVSELGMAGTCEPYEQTVFATVSKAVSEIELVESESVTIPEINWGLVEKTDNALHGGNDKYFFSDYEKWEEFKDTSNINTNGFDDIYDEYFFIRHNLAVLTIGYGDARYTSQYVDSYVKDGVLNVEYYNIQVIPDNEAVVCEPVTETLFLVTGKNATSVKPVCLGKIDYQEPETGIIGIFDVDSFYSSYEECAVFSDYESWNNYYTSSYLFYGDDSLKTAVDKDFFLKNNLVAATVSLPNLGGHDVYINSAGETGRKANIEYSLFRHTGAYPDAIDYNVILYAAAKNVTSATCTRIEYPYHHEGIITTVDASGGNKEEILLFKDYESWQNFKNTTDWQFSGYDDIFNEEYFEHSRLIIAFIELPSSQHDIEWVDYGCGNMLYELTEPEGETDGKKHYKAVICVACNRANEAHIYK